MPNVSTVPSRKRTVILWSLQILVAAAFVAVDVAKLAGVPQMVEFFDHVGFGQWFRYVTGAVEIIGGLLLLAPRSAMVGAALLLVTMVCAILTPSISF